MYKSFKKSCLILLSALVAAMLILVCAFMLSPKTTANADAEESGQSTDLYWGFDEATGELTLSSIADNPLTPYEYDTYKDGGTFPI